MTDENKGVVSDVDETLDDAKESLETPTDEKESSIAGEDGSKKKQEGSDDAEDLDSSKAEVGVKRDIDQQEDRIAQLRKNLIEKRAERRDLEKKVDDDDDDLVPGPIDAARADIKNEIMMEMHEESIISEFLRGSPAIYANDGGQENVALLKEYVHERFKFGKEPNKAEIKSAFDMAHSYLFGKLEVLKAREDGKSDAYKQMASAEMADTPTGIRSKDHDKENVSNEDRRIAKKAGIKPEVYSRYKDYYGDL